MAEVAYYFPSSTGSYTTASGSIRIKFWYTAAAASTDVAASISKIAPLQIPLEVSPGSFRYSHTKIKFQYNAGIETMLSNIETNSKQNMTFVDILIDGALYWRGLLDWESITRTDYYISGGSFSYHYIAMKIDDAMTYFWKNNKTLSNASYSDGIIIQTLIQNIFVLLGYSSLDVVCDSNIMITENCGNTYDLSDLHITNQGSATLIHIWLIDIMMNFGLFIYNLKGKIYIISRIGGTTLSISNSAIYNLQKNKNINLLDYIKLDLTFIANTKNLLCDYNTVVLQETQGNSSFKTQRNLEIDVSNILGYIYTDASGYGAYLYPIPPETVDDGDENSLIDDSQNFITAQIETGDVIRAETAPNEVNSLIYDIATIHLNFHITGTDVAAGMIYQIEIGGNDSRKRWKYYLLHKKLIAVLNEYYRSSIYLFKIQLKDISAYDDLSRRLILDGANHRARNANIDFLTDKISMELVKVT